jgi:hypothetical protein
MITLVDRLRKPMFVADELGGVRLYRDALVKDMAEAADEIERLRRICHHAYITAKGYAENDALKPQSGWRDLRNTLADELGIKQ